MNTDKKNQHYIPKFYLRNFSIDNNQKQIGIYNIKSRFFYASAALKQQGSKNFFYGHDGVIEDQLSNIEGRLATLIKNITSSLILPKRNSKEHMELLLFAVLTHIRNPVSIEGIKKSQSMMKERLLEESPESELDGLIPDISHEDAISLSLSNISRILETINDLHFKLLINKTEAPFISSDFPVVKYNSFLEKKKWSLSKTGYVTKGLQIFIPLNPELLLVFYDSGIYKIGNKKDTVCEIRNLKDINQFNVLQVLNCSENIFFNKKVTKLYIENLLGTCIGYNRPNESTAEMSYLHKEGDDDSIPKKNKNLIILGSTDCEINLQTDIVKMHSGAKKYVITNHAAQMRPLADKLLRSRYDR